MFFCFVLLFCAFSLSLSFCYFAVLPFLLSSPHSCFRSLFLSFLLVSFESAIFYAQIPGIYLVCVLFFMPHSEGESDYEVVVFFACTLPMWHAIRIPMQHIPWTNECQKLSDTKNTIVECQPRKKSWFEMKMKTENWCMCGSSGREVGR